MTDAKRIAAGLSAAQKLALLRGIPYRYFFMLRLKDGRSARALFRLGLLHLSFAPSGFTKLGIAVREILEKSHD